MPPKERPKAGAVQQLQTTIAERSDAAGSLARPVVTQVVSIHRYFASAGFTAFTGLSHDNPNDHPPTLYDVVLSDGKNTQKCLLAPRMNRLVWTGALAPFDFVSVTQGRLRYNETDRARSEPLVILLDFEMVETGVHEQWLRSGVVNTAPCDHVTAMRHTPSIGVPMSYLHISRDDAYPENDPQWRAALDPAFDALEVKMIKAWRTSHHPGAADDVEYDHSSLAKAIDERRRKNATIKPLLLTVARISQLKWSMRKEPEENGHKMPVQALVVLSDPTAEVVAVLWNTICMRYYRGLRVGDLVIVENYAVRTAKTAFYPSGFPTNLKFELVLNADGPNPRHPAATIHAVRRPHLLAGIFEQPLYSRTAFVVPAEVDNVAGDVVDMLGMVLRIGRERSHRSGSHMYSFKWVELVDPAGATCCVQVFSTSQVDEFDSLLVGMVFACTQVEVIFPPSSGGDDHMWLRTTRSTRMTGWYHETLSAPRSRPFHGVKEVEELADWTLSETAREFVLVHGCTEGRELWIPMAALDQETLLPFATAITVAKDLRLHEHRVVRIRGIVAWILIGELLDSGGEDGAGPANPAWQQVGKVHEKRRRRAARDKSSETPQQLSSGTGFRLTESDSFEGSTLESDATALFPTVMQDGAARGVFWTIALRGLNGDTAIHTVLPIPTDSEPVVTLFDLLETGGFDVHQEEEAPFDLAMKCCERLQGVQLEACIDFYRTGPESIECALLSLSASPPSA